MDRAISVSAVERISSQAARVLSRIVGAYTNGVAHGEVGAGGSGRASAAPPVAGECPTGLLYGRIQSGKTAAMIVTTASAIDNGFRVVVVLTSNIVKLVEQTAKRFEATEGPLIYSSNISAGDVYEWDADQGNIERRVATHGVVFICAKESNHQRALIAFLQEIGAADYPALIFDDEADAATPDTTLAARSQQRPTAPSHASTTYRLTVENDAAQEAGESIRQVLRHNVFVQVTATPYALLLQNFDSPLRPAFRCLVEPGEGYRGGEAFFEAVDPVAQPPLVYVPDREATDLQSGAGTAPDNLSRSVALFLLAAAAHARAQGGFPKEGYKHLSHTSPRTAAHDHLASLIRVHSDILSDELERDQAGVADREEFRWAYHELSRTIAHLPSIHLLLGDIARKIPRRKIITINAQQGPQAPFGPYFNFMVGGNILGRGLTIDDLLVTYYLRQAQIAQLDTMLQHARMFGYRDDLMAYTRVFLPYRLALRFQAIHRSEASLRELLDHWGEGDRESVPIEVIDHLRPTRPGILDARSVGTYRPGRQVYPIEPVFERALLGESTSQIDQLIEAACGGRRIDGQFIEVPLEVLVRLAEAVPVRNDDPSDWNREVIRKVLLSIGGHYGCEGALYVRNMKRSSAVFVTGSISGGEDEEWGNAKRLRMPVLFMIRESGARQPGEHNPFDGVPFWHPTVVFPVDMPNQVFNSSR